jgi:hypothetical protein
VYISPTLSDLTVCVSFSVGARKTRVPRFARKDISGKRGQLVLCFNNALASRIVAA